MPQLRITITKKEARTLYFFAAGLSAREIAEKEGIQETAINMRVHRLRRVLGAKNRVHMIAKAFALRLIPNPEAK